MAMSFTVIFVSNVINLEIGNSKFIGKIGIRRKLTQRISAPLTVLTVIILLLYQTQRKSDINTMHYTSLL